MSDHSRGVSTGVESCAGPYWSTLCYGSLLSCAALRSQCRSIRCGDSGLTKYGYVNTHTYIYGIFSNIHLLIISFAFWIKSISQLLQHTGVSILSAEINIIGTAQSGSQGTSTYFLHYITPLKLFLKFKSMWLPTKPNIVTSTDLMHWHLFIACSDHITLFSMRFEANTCCYYDNTYSCGVLHTMNKCTF